MTTPRKTDRLGTIRSLRSLTLCVRGKTSQVN